MDDTETSKRLDAIEGSMANIISILESLVNDSNRNFNAIDANFTSIEDKIDALHSDANKEFTIVKSELKKIQEVTNYEEQFKNLKIVK